MKKNIVLLLTVFMFNTVVFANDFNDIKNNFAINYISEFLDLGYFENIIDDNENKFMPSKYITRDEADILIANSLGLDNDYTNKILSYENLDEEMVFKIDDYITKEEFLSIVGSYFNYYSINENDFNDKENIASIAKYYVNYFYENGLIVGNKEGNLNPKNNLRRDEAVIILSKIIEHEARKTESFTITKEIGSGKLGFTNDSYENSSFTNISDIIFDQDGNMLIVDSLSNKIRMANNGYVHDLIGNINSTDFAGLPIGGYLDGDVRETLLNKPEKILELSDGLILFTEKESNSIRLYDKENERVITLSGGKDAGYENGNIKEAMFNRPMGMAEDSEGNIYVADTLNHVIRKIDRLNGKVTLFAGTPNNYGNELGDNLKAKFNEPVDLFIDENNIIYVVDAGNNAIKKIQNEEVSLVSGKSTEMSPITQTEIGGDRVGLKEEALYSYPMSIFVEGDIIYVADTYNNKIKKIENDIVTTIAGTGEIGNDLGSVLQATFNKPTAVIVKDNVLYIADSNNQIIKSIQLGEEN